MNSAIKEKKRWVYPLLVILGTVAVLVGMKAQADNYFYVSIILISIFLYVIKIG